MSSPIYLLRTHTQALHATLEETSAAQDLMSPAITLGRYTEILRVWAAAWQVLEKVIWTSEFSTAVPQLLPSRRLSHAYNDLRYLDYLETGLNAPPHFPESESCLVPASLSGYIGVCYVMRGASLGGKVISKHLERTLGLTRSSGMSFFSTEGDDILTWPQWMHAADQKFLALDDIEQAKLCAEKTFQLLVDVFSVPDGLSSTINPVLHTMDSATTVAHRLRRIP